MEVSPEAIYCAAFNESRSLPQEFEKKALVRFTPGSFSVSSQTSAGTFAMPVCVRFREPGAAPVMAGAGTITTTSSESSGTRFVDVGWSQPLRTAAGEDWVLEGRIEISFLGNPASVPLDGTHVFQDDFHLGFTLCQGSCQEPTDLRTLDSCTFAGVPLQRHRVAFTGGTVVLDLRIGQSMASTEPGLFVAAEGLLDGQAFRQGDYWSLVYNPEHHHFARHFLVLLPEPASADLCGIQVDGLTPWPGEGETPTLSLVDCALVPQETRTVGSHVFERP